MRTLVIGDIHGAWAALMQVLQRAHFNPFVDRLIVLGDVVDGYPDTKSCIDTLLEFPNLIALRGNHDQWFLEWLESGNRFPEYYWFAQGGASTIESYMGPVPSHIEIRRTSFGIHVHGLHTDTSHKYFHDARKAIPTSHFEYLKRTKLWYEEGGQIFVHGGWPVRRFPHPSAFGPDVFWDRSLWERAEDAAANGRKRPLTEFRDVFIGHTKTYRPSEDIGSKVPVQCCEVTNMDQGAGSGGYLSIMDVETREYWQSDRLSELYPDFKLWR